MCSSPILFATHLPASFTLLLCSVSLNWKLISPRSQIFFFGGNLCGFYVLDSSILGEYVTLSVKLYILPAALPSNKKQFARKTLYFEHQAGGVGGGMGGVGGWVGGDIQQIWTFDFLQLHHPLTQPNPLQNESRFHPIMSNNCKIKTGVLYIIYKCWVFK